MSCTTLVTTTIRLIHIGAPCITDTCCIGRPDPCTVRAMAKNLAEYLGIPDPQEPVDTPVSPAPSLKQSRKEFARAILNSTEYRDSLLWRIKMHELPPQVETLLYHYAYGKPTDIVEVREQVNKLESLSEAQLETHLLRVSERLRQLRQLASPEEGSVH